MKETLLQSLNALPRVLVEDGKKFEFSLNKAPANVWIISYFCPENNSVRVVMTGVDLHALAKKVQDHINQFCKDLIGC